MYDYEKASQAILSFYQDFQPDADIHLAFTSGRANELAGSTMIDWPGRPGTRVPDFSTHQVIEHEYMSQEEYPEFINDFMGFTLRKYLPRAFPNLKGLSGIDAVRLAKSFVANEPFVVMLGDDLAMSKVPKIVFR